jgi:hypothetical protein
MQVFGEWDKPQEALVMAMVVAVVRFHRLIRSARHGVP